MDRTTSQSVHFLPAKAVDGQHLPRARVVYVTWDMDPVQPKHSNKARPMKTKDLWENNAGDSEN